MLDLEEVKNYLRIENDFTEDDELLKSLIIAAEDYLYNQTGKRFKNNSLAKIYCLFLISDWYENRAATESGSEKIRFTLDNIVAQLTYCEVENEDS